MKARPVFTRPDPSASSRPLPAPERPPGAEERLLAAALSDSHFRWGAPPVATPLSEVGPRERSESDTARPRRRLRRLVPAFCSVCSLVAFAAVAWSVWPSRLGGATTYVVVSGKSMVPTFHTGDMVVARAGRDYRAGEVVVYRIPDPTIPRKLMIVHRIKEVRPDGTFVLQGDGNRSIDPWYPSENDIVGRKVFMIPKFAQTLRGALSPLPLGILFGMAVTWWQWPAAADDEDDDTAGARLDDEVGAGPPLPDEAARRAAAAALRSTAADLARLRSARSGDDAGDHAAVRADAEQLTESA